jgi:MtrB/PioB family decaheme-associated outer membrane protein
MRCTQRLSRIVLCSLPILVAFPAVALPAQPDGPEGGIRATGEIELGYQKIAGDTDSAKFDEYRDERQWIARGNFIFEDALRRYYLRGTFRDAGQRDEAYRLEGGRWGRWGLWGAFSEVPHEFSWNGESPYFGVNDADLELPYDRPAPDMAAAFEGALHPQDLGFQTLEAEGGGFLRPLPGLRLSTDYRLLHKHGTIFRGGLGQPFGFVGAPVFAFLAADFADFASPIDEKIHEFKADAGWSGERLSASFNYTGNLYDNRVGDSLSMDSTFVGEDVVGASSRWRMALAPDNASHNFSLAGAYRLPTLVPARLAATLSYGTRLQDEDFIPQTINSVFSRDRRLVPSQDHLDGRVNVYVADVRLDTTPLPDVDLDFHYRIYDFNNDSDRVYFDAFVVNDGTLSDAVPGQFDRRSIPNDFRRQNASVDASWAVAEPVALGFGWEWEQWSRSTDREVSRTNEHGPNLQLDLHPAEWAQLSARYAFRRRSRTSYDSTAFIEDSFNPDLVAEAAEFDVFPELRKFTLADRDRQEASVIARLIPWEGVELGVSGGLDVSDYTRTDYGVTGDERWYLGFDASWSPVQWLRLSSHYTYDHWLLEQASRERPVIEVDGVEHVVDDPLEDWSSRTTERAHNWGAEVWLELMPERLEAEVTYNYQVGRVRTHAGGPNPGAVNWPTDRNSIHLLATTLTWHLAEHWSTRLHYRYEAYRQREFQRDGIRPVSPEISTTSFFLGNEVSDYRAHIYGVSVVFSF